MCGKGRARMKRLLENRKVFITFMTILMAAVIVLIGESLSDGVTRSVDESGRESTVILLPHESAVFRRASQALAYLSMANEAGTRTLSQFYQRRAYPGAPPIIPHELESEQGIGGKVCLSCHENGGYVPKFNAYAPVVPHPEYSNCRQCHVPAKTTSLFRASSFQAMTRPVIDRSAMPDAPPMMPHDLQMRDNCLACHAGPGAVKEIRVPHPERSNCRQCHLPMQTDITWSRPVR